MKRRLTETMCGVCVSRATWANFSISVNDVPNGFSITHGRRRSSSLIPTSTIFSIGITETHASGFSTFNISSRSLYGRTKPNDRQNSTALSKLRSHAARSSIAFGCAAAYLASGAAWLLRECSPQPAIAMRIIAPPRSPTAKTHTQQFVARGSPGPIARHRHDRLFPAHPPGSLPNRTQSQDAASLHHSAHVHAPPQIRPAPHRRNQGATSLRAVKGRKRKDRRQPPFARSFH